MEVRGRVREVTWMHIFRENLTRMMIEENMNQVQLSDASGISQSTISKYLNGLQMPTAINIVNLSYALRCSADDLIDFGERVKNESKERNCWV